MESFHRVDSRRGLSCPIHAIPRNGKRTAADRSPGRRHCSGVYLKRAIGVIYRPETERASHYFQARLSRQFDAVLHFDETEAVRPLERAAAPDAEPAETFPTGL